MHFISYHVAQIVGNFFLNYVISLEVVEFLQCVPNLELRAYNRPNYLKHPVDQGSSQGSPDLAKRGHTSMIRPTNSEQM